MRAGFVATALVSGLVLGGCSFSTSVPEGRRIACGASGNAPCPTGYTCRAAIGQCIAVTALAQSPAGVINASIVPQVGNAAATFTLQFNVTAALARPPVAYASAFQLGTAAGSITSYPFTCGACAVSAPCVCTYSAGGGALPPDGPLDVHVAIVDALGNAPPAASVGSIAFDSTPPDITPPTNVLLTPPPGALTPVSSLGPGGAAEVCFTSDEPLFAIPQVWASASSMPSGLAFTQEDTSPQGLRYCFTASMGADAGIPDGPTPLWATLTDLAGNVATRNLVPDGGLDLDTTPPPPPDMSAAAGLVFRRTPWGDLAHPAVPSYSLRSLGNAIGEGGFLVAYADVQRLQRVGILPVTAGTMAEAPLPPPDVPELFVDAIDPAGNAAPGGPFLVHNVELVSTLGLKIAGDTQSNPNACHGRPVAGIALLEDDDARTEQGALDGPSGETDAGAQVISGASWHPRSPNAPTNFASATGGQAAFAYDSARAAWVGALYANDFQTWSYDGTDFGLVPNVQNTPGARTDMAVAYDARRGRTVLYGGVFSGISYCDTWEWDGFTWTRFDDCVLGAQPDGGQGKEGPGPLVDASLTYDPVRQRTILVGGARPDYTDPQGVWEWDGQAWTQLVSDGGAPPARSQAPMAYASYVDGGGALVLSGGTLPTPYLANNTFMSDTWLGVWDGAAYAWSVVGTSSPCPSSLNACVWMTGNPADGSLLRAVWTNVSSPITFIETWDGANPAGWASLSRQYHVGIPSGLGVGPAFGASAIVVYAVTDLSESPFEDAVFTCPYDSSPCTMVHEVEDVPVTPRNQSALAFDGEGTAVMMGGDATIGSLAANDLTSVDYEDVYVWNGLDWISAVVGPSARQEAGEAYFSSLSQTWLFGGSQVNGTAMNDLWSRDDAGNWTPLTVTPALPTYSAPILVDATEPGAAEAFYLFDSDGIAHSYQLTPLDDGGVHALDIAPAAETYDVAYDTRRSVLVATSTNGGLLEFTPADGGWQSVAPTALSGARIFYDRARGRSLIANPSDPTLVSIAEWDGVALRALPVATPSRAGGPKGLYSPSAAFDTSRERLLLFGGVDNANDFSASTWELRLAENHPAETCLFPVGAAREPAGTQVAKVAIDGVAGAAVNLPDGTTQPSDAILQVWSGSIWTEATRCAGATCTPATPAALHYEVDDPLQASKLAADLNTVGVQITSAQPNGAGFAQVAVPQLQAILSLRIP